MVRSSQTGWSADSITQLIRTSDFVRTVSARVSRRRKGTQETYSRMNDPIISKAYSTMGNMPNQNQPKEAKELEESINSRTTSVRNSARLHPKQSSNKSKWFCCCCCCCCCCGCCYWWCSQLWKPRPLQWFIPIVLSSRLTAKAHPHKRYTRNFCGPSIKMFRDDFFGIQLQRRHYAKDRFHIFHGCTVPLMFPSHTLLLLTNNFDFGSFGMCRVFFFFTLLYNKHIGIQTSLWSCTNDVKSRPPVNCVTSPVWHFQHFTFIQLGRGL